jgi:hypothetical protein
VDLPPEPLTGDGVLTAGLRARGLVDFAQAARWVQALPYGRTSNRDDVTRVVTEGRGTCSTKHALLAALAAELGLDLVLTLGIYEMSEANTPGVGPVLERHGLTSIPEAHCYLMGEEGRIDLTREVVAAEPISAFLHEEPIRVDQIGAYKTERHRRALAEWIARDGAAGGRTLSEVWAIREECIARLSAP